MDELILGLFFFVLALIYGKLMWVIFFASQYFYISTKKRASGLPEAPSIHARAGSDAKLSRLLAKGVPRIRTDVYLQKAGNLFLENRLLKFVIVVMAVAVAFNSLLVLRTVKYQRIVLIPPQLTGTIEFVQGRPTDSYIRDLTRRIISTADGKVPHGGTTNIRSRHVIKPRT